MAIPNCDYYEVFPCSGANKYALVNDIEVDSNGFVHAPEGDGLGVEIDWNLVEEKTIQSYE
jgi:L-alanine-DL-glutamate epimerase-like enolase superfamily enzyme